MAKVRFLRELRRRHVFRVAAGYAVVGWLLIQIATQVFPFFDLPNWSVRLIVLIVLAGFPIALVLAWAFDATPHGIVRTPDADGSLLRSRRAGIAVGAIGVLIAVLAGYGYWRWHGEPVAGVAPKESRAPTLPSVTAPVPPVVDKSIAVLPFENLSDDKANAYFADGMQDEILTRLSGIADLKVISRTSTERYKSQPENLHQVGVELGVTAVLEGSVQKSGEAVRVNVKLIDTHSDAQLWANSYDRELKNVFNVESEVAQQIADVLKARLSPQETTALAKAPTQNAAAYDTFLKAESLARKARDSLEDADFDAADAAYRQAIALDPDFALAHARLAYNAIAHYWFNKQADSELPAIKASADRALALAPDLPEAHLALGFYFYWGHRQYDEAIAQFQQALQLSPNNADALTAQAFAFRRKGDWAKALEYLKRGLQVSPLDPTAIREYGNVLAVLRRFPEAEQQFHRALIIDPNDGLARGYLIQARLSGEGDAAGAREASHPPPPWRLSATPVSSFDAIVLVNPRVYPDVFNRDFDAALHDWDSAPTTTDDERVAQRAARVVIQLIAGRRGVIGPECAALKPMLDALFAKDPGRTGTLQQASWIDVCLGRNADALASARRVVALMPTDKDAFAGAYALAGLAEIDAQAGDADEAIATISTLLAMPAGNVMTIKRLKLDPVFDPLRKDSRFQNLLDHAVEKVGP